LHTGFVLYAPAIDGAMRPKLETGIRRLFKKSSGGYRANVVPIKPCPRARRRARESASGLGRNHDRIDGNMKTFLSILMLVALTSIASAAKEGWLDDLEKAKAQAKAENKKILLDFTGSDWCGWCKKLDKEVFSQQAWKDYAAKHLVLVEVDFPRGFQLPEATKKQNDELAKKYKIQGYPTIVITGASGIKKGELGYVEGGPEAFIKALKKVD
jgi:thioredoxin-related protein